jgi:hypothetical protein
MLRFIRGAGHASRCVARLTYREIEESFLVPKNRLSRNQLYFGLFLLACLNGIASKIIQSIDQVGWSDAILATFDVSAVVLLSCISGLFLVHRSADETITIADVFVSAVAIILVVLPIGPLSWLAVSFLGFYLVFFAKNSTTRQGAIILFAVTVPMLWSRLVFQLFANFILKIDALLVSSLLHTHRSGNIVDFADGSGQLVILPACSSLANVSLAVLCWVTISELSQHRRSLFDIFWCFCACASVVVVNVVRMSLMGISQDAYETVHSPPGDAVVGVVILFFTVSFCLVGVRRELFPRIQTSDRGIDRIYRGLEN